ncbi:MAG: ABC-2 family transporter protein [Alphaproteobacteria bacterium]|nr:ABC-2 family transporter protein [Alphaproteobacteria bacterium]
MHLLRALPDIFRVSFAGVVAYRAEMVIWILTSTMPLIMLALWNAVVDEAPLMGFGPTEITRYFAATLLVRQLTSSWLLWELNEEIRTGSLSMKLLRPMHPLWVHAADMLAAMPTRMVVLLPMLLALVAWRPELLALPDAWALAAFLPSVFLAWLLGFLVQAAFACLAFWLEQTQGLFALWFGAWMLLSGYLAPLEMFPEAAQPLLGVLPFRGMLAAPVELLTGRATPQTALADLGVQLVWTVAGFAVVRALWNRGLARYGAYGA